MVTGQWEPEWDVHREWLRCQDLAELSTGLSRMCAVLGAVIEAETSLDSGQKNDCLVSTWSLTINREHKREIPQY
jgi:RAB protein geranylgeranyltransferase component A